MKILILTISAGQGHHQTAAAMENYFLEAGESCRVLDAYKYISPILSDSVEKSYLLSTQYTPKMYGSIYKAAEHKKPRRGFSFWSFTNGIMGRKLQSYIEDYNPDVVICTHIFSALAMTYMAPAFPNAINIGIITDFTVHPFWEDTELDYYVTASHLLTRQCVKKGIPEEKVLPFGIPIHKKFSNSMDKAEARELLGISDKTTFLIMMGSMGYGNVGKLVKRMDTIDFDFQILCVCGRNMRAKRNIDTMKTAHDLYSYGFVDNVDVMMDAADFIVTKPGGLSMSEVLTKGLPAILVNPIPGQEDRNLDFFLNNGLAMHVSSTFPIDEAVFQLLSNKWKAKYAPGASRYFAKVDSAKQLGDFVLALKKHDEKDE